eukprot:6201707-Pleurochrysis_carterae.AAC.4
MDFLPSSAFDDDATMLKMPMAPRCTPRDRRCNSEAPRDSSRLSGSAVLGRDDLEAAGRQRLELASNRARGNCGELCR